MSIRRRIPISTLLAALFITGCGSDGDSSSAAPPATSELVTLTSNNATTVAAVVAEQVVEDGLFGTLTRGLPIVSAGPGAAAALTNLSAAPLPPGMLAVTASTLEQCAVDGTVDVTVDVSDPQTVSVNDRFTFEFNDCDDGTGVALDGGLDMTVSGFDGDPSADNFYLALSIELNAFQVTEGGDVTGASGSVNIEIDSTMPPITTITVSTAALTTTRNGVTEVVSNMSVTVTENENTFPPSVAIDTSFRISTPRLGGDVIVSTSLGLESSGDGFPFMGELEIRAADDAVIVIIALGADTVRLEIDIDGDTVPDEVVDMTWEELLAAANAA